MKKIILLTTAFSLCAAASAHAQTGVLAGWEGEASLNGARTTGNTDTLDFGAALKLEKNTDTWNHKLKGSALFGETDDVSTRERYDIGYQIERNFSERLYAYGNADYYADEFGAFSSGYFIGGGLGYRVFLPEPLGWALEGGPGFRSQVAQDVILDEALFLADPTDPLGFTEGDRSNEFALRGRSDFDYKINDNVSFYNDTEVLWSDSDTYVWNEVGITAQLVGNLAARASYRVDHHTNPPLGTVGTDTITKVGVVYTLK